MVGKERHRSCAVVGFQVDHDLPASPGAVWVVVVEIDRHGVTRQHNAIHETGTRILARGNEVDAAVLSGQVGIGTGGLIAHRRQHRAVAVSIVTHAEAGAPPVAEHIDLYFNRASRGEVELELGSGLMGGHLAVVGVGIVEKHPHGFVGSGLSATTEVLRFQVTTTGTVGARYPSVLSVQHGILSEVVEIKTSLGLSHHPNAGYQ